MRRRVARVVMVLLAVVGVVLLVSLPVSFVYVPGVHVRGAAVGGSAYLNVCLGAVTFEHYSTPENPRTPPSGVEVYVFEPRSPNARYALWPQYSVYRRYQGQLLVERLLIVPLWLLAVICLAWPVTSFTLARRRHKRGFPVEVATSSGVGSGPPLPPGEGVTQRGRPGDRAE